jgi:hypothetical protein
MYFDLKEVLKLNRVYPANPNAVAMRVYAAGVVYNALRVAQGEVSEAAGVTHEAISPAKFFPKMAAACDAYALLELWFWQAQRANPWRRLRKPALHERRFASVALDAIRVEPPVLRSAPSLEIPCPRAGRSYDAQMNLAAMTITVRLLAGRA